MKSKRSKACDIPKAVKDKVWERDNHRCIICGSPYAMPNAHFIRRSKSGRGIEQNIVTLCLHCHHDYDNGPIELSKPIKDTIKQYLTHKYDNWSEENLIYKKGG